MDAESESKIATTSHGGGSLEGLNFGACTLNELAGLVNWENRSDFVPPHNNPWVDLASSGDREPSSPTPAEVPTESPFATRTPKAEGPAGTLGKAEPDNEIDHIPDDTASDSVPVAEPTETPVSADASGEVTSPQVSMANEAATLGDSADESDPSDAGSNQEQAIRSEIEAVDEVTDHDVPEAQPEGTSAATTEVAQGDQKVTDSSAGIGSRMRAGVSQATSVPHVTQSLMSSNNENQHSQEDYLQRLESLVLTLNLQLAQRASDAPNQPADITQWLSQRVIDLSLENMALNEKLQAK